MISVCYTAGIFTTFDCRTSDKCSACLTRNVVQPEQRSLYISKSGWALNCIDRHVLNSLQKSLFFYCCYEDNLRIASESLYIDDMNELSLHQRITSATIFNWGLRINHPQCLMKAFLIVPRTHCANVFVVSVIIILLCLPWWTKLCLQTSPDSLDLHSPTIRIT